MTKFNRHLWQQFWEIAKPYWFSEEKWKARGMLLLLGILLLAQTEFNVLFNEQTGEFTSALAARDADRFWQAIRFCLFILIVAVPIYSFYYIDRLSTFAKSLAGPTPGKPAAELKIRGVIHSVQDSRLALEKVTLQTPDYKRTLITDLSLEVKAGASLLIVGASGEGKSSLLRAISGLWDAGSGIIVRPGPEDMLFLPQHPYMILGNLRSQLLYPNKAGPAKNAAGKIVHAKGHKDLDEELLQLLNRVNLPHLSERLGGLDADIDWGKVLSVGEQQRLAIARVLLNQPRFAMLDEATSALDAENEDSLYRELMQTSTTLVSISHRPTVLKFHQQVLELTGNGNWQLHPASSYSLKN